MADPNDLAWLSDLLAQRQRGQGTVLAPGAQQPAAAAGPPQPITRDALPKVDLSTLNIPQPPAWTSWGLPLIAAAGAALSTPSAGGAGPIIGNALQGGVGTYEQMLQARQKAAIAMAQRQQAIAHQQAMEQLSLDRYNEAARHNWAQEQASGRRADVSEAAQLWRETHPPGGRDPSVHMDEQVSRARAEFTKALQLYRVQHADAFDKSDLELYKNPSVITQAQMIANANGVPLDRVLGVRTGEPPPGAKVTQDITVPTDDTPAPAHTGLSNEQLQEFLKTF